MIVSDACGYAVVHDHTVLVQHETVPALAGRKLRPGIGVDAIEELAHVLAADIDLAEC